MASSYHTGQYRSRTIFSFSNEPRQGSEINDLFKLTLIINFRIRIGSWFFVHPAVDMLSGKEINLVKIEKQAS